MKSEVERSAASKGETTKSSAAKVEVELGKQLAEALDAISYAIREDLLTEYEVRRDGELPYALGRYLHYIDLYGAEGALAVGAKAHVCLTDSSRLVGQLVAEGMVRKEDYASPVVGAKGVGGKVAAGSVEARGKRKRGQPKARLFLTEEGRQELAAVRRAWRSVGARIAKMLSGELPSERQAFVKVAASLGRRLGGTR